MVANQSFIQTQSQTQTQIQQQRFTNQQVQFMRLLEMPLAQFEQNVETELRENEALVENFSKDPSDDNLEQDMQFAVPTYESKGNKSDTKEPDENESHVESNSENFDDEAIDESPNYEGIDSLNVLYDKDDAHDRRLFMEQTVNEGETLHQQLVEQINMLELNDEEMEISEYILGMLNNDGLLQKSPEMMAEELFLFQNIDTNAQQVQKLINKLKQLDPAGICAQSLQECLLIQVDRRKKSSVTTLMKRILTDCFNNFIHGRINKIYTKIGEDEALIDEALEKIRHLNPRPGAGLGENISEVAQQVTPDFIVETENDKVFFSINYGKIPALAVTEDYDDLIRQYEGLDREKIRKKEYEAYVYARSRVKRANSFIHLVKLRFRTLYITMKHIVDHQKTFFLSGDENDLKPLMIKEIAQEMNYDISTISRACNNKYVQTEWGTFPMKHFFAASYASKTDDGEDVTLLQIHSAIREIIESEDSRHPYSDDKIASLLKEKGYNLARRTVAKHRERLGFNVARLRKH